MRGQGREGEARSEEHAGCRDRKETEGGAPDRDASPGGSVAGVSSQTQPSKSTQRQVRAHAI
eukprot:169236-Rhodomonas_salina.2